MANNVLRSWLGGFQTPTPIPEPAPVPTSYQRSIDNIKRLLPYLTDAQARDYATRLQTLYNKFAVYGWTKSTPEPTPIPTTAPIPTPAPELRPYPTPGLLRRRSEAAARWQKRQRTLSNYPRLPQSTIPSPTVEYPAAPLKDWLSNYPRLPQSTIPTPTVEYPAPGRPPQSTIPTPAVEYPAPGRPPKYNNPFAWRRKNNGWW